MLREKEAQFVPMAGTLAGAPSASGAFKSPERLRPADERSAAAARAMSPLRETSMLIPGAIVRSGWLWRKGMMNNWKKKWFTIIGSSIYYADTKVPVQCAAIVWGTSVANCSYRFIIAQ